MGFDIKRFENLGDLEDELICSICFAVFDNPYVLSSCGHTFCKECIDKWFQRKRICPNDGISVGLFRELIPAPIPLKNIISKLKIHCDHQESGCDSVVQLQDLQTHLQNCPFRPKPPPPTHAAVIKKLFTGFVRHLLPVRRHYGGSAERSGVETTRQPRNSPFRLVTDYHLTIRPRRIRRQDAFDLHQQLALRFGPHVILSWFIAILVFLGFCLISFMIITFIDNMLCNMLIPVLLVVAASTFVAKAYESEAGPEPELDVVANN